MYTGSGDKQGAVALFVYTASKQEVVECASRVLPVALENTTADLYIKR